MTVQPEFSRQARRWARLMAGLVAFGVGIALMKHADLGLGPWEVLNDGLSRITGVSLGTVGIVVGVPILLLWLPLRDVGGKVTGGLLLTRVAPCLPASCRMASRADSMMPASCIR